MAKCLRCGAGNEWIQGRVRVEAKSAVQPIVSQSGGAGSKGGPKNWEVGLALKTLDMKHRLLAFIKENSIYIEQDAEVYKQEYLPELEDRRWDLRLLESLVDGHF